jgi:hypothetical protein
MATKGRPRAQQPATAWDYHRALALVQALASDAPMSGIAALCEAWGVPLGFDSVETIRALAKHALEHGREEKE